MSESAIKFPGIDSLSMDDIIDWVGERLVQRGVNYQREKRVSDLAILPNGTFVANVKGNAVYSVAVLRDCDGDLESHCTCPYSLDCKHGVAALLEYIECVNKGQSVAPLHEEDERLMLFPEDFADFFEQMYDGIPQLSHNPQLSDGTIAARVQSYLSAMTKEELLHKIYELMPKIPELCTHLDREVDALTADVPLLVKKFRAALESAADEGEYDSWSDSIISDFSKAREIMNLFIESGNEDALLNELNHFLEVLQDEMDECVDDGDTGDELEQCLEIFLKALRASKRPVSDKIIVALTLVLKEEYGLSGDFESFLHEEYSEADWGIAAAFLEKHSQNELGNVSTYERKKIIHWLSFALERSGRQDDIVLLHETEALLTNDYKTLVRQCIEKGKYDEGLKWIAKGLKAEKGASASILKEQQRTIYEKQENWKALLPEEVIAFAQTRSEENFTQCLSTTSKLEAASSPTLSPDASLVANVRTCLLGYLVEGTLPWKHKAWPADLKINVHIPKNQYQAFPDLRVLLNIAIAEKSADDVLHWYKMIPKGSNFDAYFLDSIAKALQEKHADVAVTLWKKLAENTISIATKDAYATACAYLRKIHACLLAQDLQSEWTEYMAYLKGKHARKRLFLQALSTIAAF